MDLNRGEANPTLPNRLLPSLLPCPSALPVLGAGEEQHKQDTGLSSPLLRRRPSVPAAQGALPPRRMRGTTRSRPCCGAGVPPSRVPADTRRSPRTSPVGTRVGVRSHGKIPRGDIPACCHERDGIATETGGRERGALSLLVFRRDESPRGGIRHSSCFSFGCPEPRGLAPAAWERRVAGGGKSGEL